MTKKLINLSLLFTIYLSLVGISAQTEQKAELVVQSGHNQGVFSISFSPDGKLLASGGGDGKIKLWDSQTGQEIKTIGGSLHKILSVAFSPDGKYLGNARANGTVELWDIATGKKIRVFGLPPKKDEFPKIVHSVIFSPDGSILAGNKDSEIKLWNVNTGEELRTFFVHSFGNSITFSPDGKMLAVGSVNTAQSQANPHLTNPITEAITEVKLLSLDTGEEIKTFSGQIGLISSVTFNPDGKTLASGSWNNDIKLWDVKSGQELKTLTGHTSPVFSVAFSPDGKFLASGSDDKTIKLWNIETGKEPKTFAAKNGVRSVAFSPDGSLLANGYGGSFITENLNEKNYTITLWNVKTGQEEKTLTSHTSWIPSVALSPDKKMLASANWDNTVKLWNLETETQQKVLKGHTDTVIGVIFSHDGKLLASDSGDNTVRVWNVNTGQELRVFTGKYFASGFAPDNKRIAITAFNNLFISIYNIETGKLEKTLIDRPLVEHTRFILTAFSADQKMLATVSLETNFSKRTATPTRLKLWNLKTGKELKTLSEQVDSIDEIAFSPDGKILVSRDKIIKLWDVETGQMLKTFPSNDPNARREIEKIAPDFYKFNTISADGRWSINTYRGDGITFIDQQSKTELASLIALDNSDWAVVTPEGLFDASSDARKLIHYVIGLEPIILEQMKDVYYVPGLLQKIFKGEPLPKVELFSKKDLFPDAEFSPPKAGQKDLSIKLTNRGGGIGQVQILVNNKEFVADARPKGFDPNVKTATLTVSLKDAPLVAGRENKIEVVARNAAGSLSNRGTPRGSEIVVLGGDRPQTAAPNIYAIVSGISDYTGNNLDLSFAAKDAEDFAKAIELGAVKLLGDKSKVHIRLLSSNTANSSVKFDAPDARISTATKADFQKAFADFRNATPNDVFIVYLAGHGVSLNLNQNPAQAGGDTYLYLTQEATTTDKSVLSVKQSREAMTVSSEELKELMKQNKALKQVFDFRHLRGGSVVKHSGCQTRFAVRPNPGD